MEKYGMIMDFKQQNSIMKADCITKWIKKKFYILHWQEKLGNFVELGKLHYGWEGEKEVILRWIPK